MGQSLSVPAHHHEKVSIHGLTHHHYHHHYHYYHHYFNHHICNHHYLNQGFIPGIDGTKAFVTGDFNKAGLIDEIDGLSDDECVALNDWAKFYDSEYTFVGKVIGNFYDKDGKETVALKDFHEKLKNGLKAREKDKEEKTIFPECNSKWSKEEGTQVWCTDERYMINICLAI